ncbi:3-oxoacyl-ACP reductase FabG [Lactiplantibacillus modestisalitolerans]|uniref:3-oxoacyl-ACP reductase FabG n=1 Tax=Lactiplantibacillus modestisalitolerans TaxID=1457219 RepID=A0ABV5WWH5_9LACO|nr:3-oxoacyl-ACP reductase FabG [Lactiplantibacillus modestisalitolerans]
MTNKRPVYLVTGAAKGIGLATVQRLAPQAEHVVMNVHRPIVTEHWAALTAIYPNISQLVADVGDAKQAEQLVNETIARHGRIDGLVNNAGITRDQLVMRMSTTDFMAVLQTNLVGAFNVLKPTLKQMLRQRSGAIVNVASVIGSHGNVGQANYAASKAGLVGLTKTVAREGARRQVRCNAVAPGMIATAMTDALPEAIRQQTLTEIPLKRFGQPEEIATAIDFLLHQPYLTGQVLTVDGGMTM